MNAKLIPAALLVAALGCAGSTTPQAPVAPKKTTVAAKPRELRSAGIAQSMQPLMNAPRVVASKNQEGGVSLTGPDRSYLERVDNSGWSGRSAPAPGDGIGGGPSSDESNPYEEEDQN
jgi:hypothetical protein